MDEEIEKGGDSIMNIIYFLIQQTMFFSIPLLIVALGGMFSERSGVINIALEGIMVMGAFISIGFILSLIHICKCKGRRHCGCHRRHPHGRYQQIICPH